MNNKEIFIDENNTNNDIYENLVEKWILQCIYMGYSPKRLLQNVFNTIDKKLDGEIKTVVYCGCYGGYSFSTEFKSYLESYHKKLDEFERERERQEIYKYIEQFAEHLNIDIDKALERASGKYCKLKIKKIPKHREYRIHEYDGCEYVEILKDFIN